MTTALRSAFVARRRQRVVLDWMLMAPLLLFLLVVFVVPIGVFLIRAVDGSTLHAGLPRTHAALAGWQAPDPVPEAAFTALALDLRALPSTAEVAVMARLLNNFDDGFRGLLMKTANTLPDADPASWQDALLQIDKRWAEPMRWAVLKRETGRLTASYVLAALDLTRDETGAIVRVEPERRLYLALLARTFQISLTVAVLCLLLGYPTAYLLTTLPPRVAGIAMICVLLPFWTSLLVRTTAWIVLLQGNGPINTALQFANIIEAPLTLIFNRFGTLVAMTHVLLPYMILPIYSAMLAVPKTQMLAAQSLGARPRVAFFRVYLPQTFAGVAAGLTLVFVLALGYYITPALVGGPQDQMVSYMIAWQVNEMVNWGMASALGLMLFLTTIILIALVGRFLSLRRAFG